MFNKLIIANNKVILCKQCVKIKHIKQGKGQNEQLIRSKNNQKVFQGSEASKFK